MPELRERVANERAKPLSMEEIARLGLGLRTALQQDDRNINDWMMLGRVGMALNNATTATQAFAHAYQLDPNSLEVRLGYAEVLTRSNDPEDNKRGDAAVAAYDRGKSRRSAGAEPAGIQCLRTWRLQAGDRRWQVMLQLLPANDPRAEVIKRSIAQTKAEPAEKLLN